MYYYYYGILIAQWRSLNPCYVCYKPNQSLLRLPVRGAARPYLEDERWHEY